MRFEVPQFIEIEDKIFGPFTWRQFLYLGGGIGMAVVMFFTMPFIIFVILGIPLAILAGALSFYPVNNRPFSYFLEAIFGYARSQRLYLWKQKSNRIYKNEQPEKDGKPMYAAPPTIVKSKTKKDISSLARKLELQALQKPE
jgi:hypothetical protein